MNTKRIGLIILIVGLVVAGLIGSQAFAVRNAKADSKSFVGSWNVEITVILQNAAFPGLVTFFNDGNLIADETPSPLETSGHGAWEKTGPDQAAYSFVFLIGSTAPGEWLIGTVSGTAAYDQKMDQWNGPFTITIVDQAGNEIVADTGTMSGTRITAVP